MELLDKRQKYTNKKQFEVLVNEMKLHPDVAKGFSQRAPADLNSFWVNTSQKLNALGPPIKDKTGWKKVWTDFKFGIKKKMVKNAKQISGTGGGPFSQIALSPLEEEVSVILSINTSVEGLKGIRSFGCSPVTSQDEIPTTSGINKRPLEALYSQPQTQNESLSDETPDCAFEMQTNADTDFSRITHKKHKTNKVGLLEEQIAIQKNLEQKVSKVLDTLLKQQSDQVQGQTETNRWLRKLHENEKDKLKEMRRHNAAIEKMARDKLETKKKLLELELQHLNKT